MISERIESKMTRQDKTVREKQSEIIDEQKSKKIITHTNFHKNSKMMTDSNNKRNENKKTKKNERYKTINK